MRRGLLAVGWPSLVVSLLALVSCGTPPASAPPPHPLTSTLFPTTAPEEDAPLPGAATPAPCTNDALFLDDLTLPDGSVVPAGAQLVKRWSVVNVGTCDWGGDYRLVHVDGEGLVGPEAVALFPARAGSTAVWEIVFQAPGEPGEYRSVWQAQAPDGTLFGEVVYVTVVVTEPTSTPATLAP